MHKSVKIAFFWIWVAFAMLMLATWFTFKVALRDPVQVIDKHYYEKGLEFEENIQLQKQLIKDGYRMDGFPEKLTTGDNAVILQLRKNEKNVTDAKVTLLLERLATDRFNVRLGLIADASGNYTGNLSVADNGKWLLTVVADFDGKKFVKSETFIVGN